MKFSSEKTVLAHLDQSYFFRHGIKHSLKQSTQFDLQISIGQAKSLLAKLNSTPVDILLLGNYDASVFPVDKLLISLMKDFPRVSVIALQTLTDIDKINHLVKMGIKCFLPKTVSENGLLNSLEIVRRDGFFLNEEITSDLIERMQKEQKMSDLNLALSGIEREILQLVSNGYTAEEMSAKLHKSKKTIEGYRSRMLKKTNVKNIAELVAWGFRNEIVR